jgi:hypothetical protein
LETFEKAKQEAIEGALLDAMEVAKSKAIEEADNNNNNNGWFLLMVLRK